MTETVVHITTIEEWKSVLDVWFKQGYDWSYINKGKGYKEGLFYNGSRQLGLNVGDDDEISYWSLNGYNGDNLIEYSEFMSRQKDEHLTTPTEEQATTREVTIVFQNGEMKSFTGVTDISLNNSTITFYIQGYTQGDYGNTIMEATFYTNTISGYLTNSI